MANALTAKSLETLNFTKNYNSYIIQDLRKSKKALIQKGVSVRGFAYPISKELPIEYAVEMNNLINMELEGAIG